MECLILSIILICLKLFYGLNDLPYLINIHKKENHSNEILTKIKINYFKFLNVGKLDNLKNYYEKMPSFTNLLKFLVDKILNDSNSKFFWKTQKIKTYCNKEYKEKILKTNKKFYSLIDNSFTINNINSLEKKINITSKFTNKHTKKFEIKSSKFFNLKNNKKREDLDFKISKIHFFLNEEIQYYEKFNKNFNKKIKVPLPCETYLKYNKKSMKLENINPQTSELILYYFLSKQFKIDYKVFKKFVKLIEKTIEI